MKLKMQHVRKILLNIIIPLSTACDVNSRGHSPIARDENSAEISCESTFSETTVGNGAGSEGELCNQEASYSFDDGQFQMIDQRPESILVVEGNIAHAKTIRYRTRFKAFLEFSEGTLRHANPSIKIPRGLGDFIKKLDSVEFQSAITTQPYWDIVTQKYPDYWKLDQEHNSGILGAIIEHNPKHAIVALDRFTAKDILGIERFCRSDIDFFEIMQHIEVTRAQLQKKLDEYEIGYVNFSMGFSQSDIRKQFIKTCRYGPSPEQLRLIEEAMGGLLEVFGKAENVILVQSAAYDGKVGESDKDNENYPHRIRVGAINVASSGLGPDGTSLDKGDFDTSFRKFNGIGTYADVYVNLGVDFFCKVNSATFLTPGPLGIGLVPISNIASTSDAAPLALSRIIHLKETFFPDQKLNHDTIEALMDMLTPKQCPYLRADARCVFQDPSQHKQFMVFSMGYR